MVEVTVREGEPLERALRRFKKKWERAGIQKSYYVKPSDKKRAERKKAARRMTRISRY
jgi:small subunit ribosomal protein S21